jgi:hypothetical protein
MSETRSSWSATLVIATSFLGARSIFQAFSPTMGAEGHETEKPLFLDAMYNY